MAATREDIWRTILDELVTNANIAGVEVHLDDLISPEMTQNEWLDFQPTGWVPENGRTSHQIDNGSVRVACRVRPLPAGDSLSQVGRAYALADKVIAALRWRDLTVKDFASGSGTSTVGNVAMKEAAIEDQGAFVDGVRTVMVTIDCLFSGTA